MKVLYIAPRLPCPALDRENVRPYQQLRALALRHDVDLIAFGDPERSIEKRRTLSRFCNRITVVPAPSSPAIVPGSARHAVAQRPLALRGAESDGLLERLESIARWECYDVVFVYSTAMAPYGRAFPETPKIVDLVEAASRRWELAGADRGVVASALFRREGKRLRSVERRALEDYEQVLVASKYEADALRALDTCPYKVEVMRTPVPTQAPVRRRPSALPTILLAGHMDHVPNVDAALHFAARVFPRIRRALPDAVLRIAGRRPPAEVRALANHKSIFVDPGHIDLREHYAEAWVAVVPHQLACGVRNEVIEALSMGMPTVVSREACRGIDTDAADALEVTASPQDMATRIIRLLYDERLRTDMAERARRKMQTGASYVTEGNRLEDLVSAAGALALIPS